MHQLNTNLSKETFQKLRRDLDIFNTNHPALFKNLFQQNELIEYNGACLNELFAVGLVMREEKLWSCHYSLYETNGLYFFTDSFLLARVDRVFPLSQDESLFLANRLNVNCDETILDIGTGSGIYAVTAARNGGIVTAVDINMKALNYARFNALLNNVEDKIEFLDCNIFEKLKNRKFDLIVSNPAIIPTASNSGFYTHSDGGIDGTSMSFEIIKNFGDYLNPSGRFQMLATSFTTLAGSTNIEEFIIHCYAGKRFKFYIQELYTPCLEELGSLTAHFKKTDNYEAFITYIRERNFKSLRYLYIKAEAMLPFEIEWVEKEEEFENNQYNGNWQGRLARLFMVYPKIAVRKISEKIIN